MAALKLSIVAAVLLACLSACSMQPLIDVGLPDNTPVYTPPAPSEEPPIVTSQEPAPKQPDQRQAEVAKAAELPPAVAALITRAETQLQTGETQAAIATLERALNIAPRSAEVYYQLAKVYAASNDNDRARSFANKALSLSPNKGLERDIHGLLNGLGRVSYF